MPAALALVAVLPGCLTSTLWESEPTDEPRDPVSRTEFVDETVQRTTGVIDVVLPVLDNALWWRDQSGAAIWRLRADVGADLAMALLADQGLCRIEQVHIEARRGNVEDEVLSDQALMSMTVSFMPAAIGRIVSAAAIEPSAATVLATARGNAFVFAADPVLFLPKVFRGCVQRLGSIDFAAIVDRPGEWGVESWVYVGPDGQPRFEPGLPARAIPDGADDPDRPLQERLDLLSDFDLLVRLRGGDESLVVRLRPDRLWLWSAVHAQPGGVVHRSAWRLEPVPGDRVPPAAVGSLTIPGELILTEQRFRRVSEATDDLDFWQKLALTPITLALDLTVGLPFNLFWSWLNEDEEQDEPWPRVRRQ